MGMTREIYFIFDEMKKHFPQMIFEQISHCAGVFLPKETIIDLNKV